MRQSLSCPGRALASGSSRGRQRTRARWRRRWRPGFRGCDRRGGDRADTGNGRQPPGRLVGLDRRCDLPVERSDRLVERIDLTDERTKRGAHAIGDHDLAVVIEAVGGHALEVIGVLAALRRDDADLGHVAAQRVEQRSALTRQQLARCSAPTRRRRPATAAGCHTGRAACAALPMPALRRPHDRDRGVRTRLRATVAADPNRERHIMNQTACQRRRLPVPLRRLHAGDDLAQPNSWQSMRPAPVDALQNQPGTLLSLSRPPPGAGMQVASPQCRAPIECGR